MDKPQLNGQTDILDKYRNNPRWAEPQLLYIEAKVMLEAAEGLTARLVPKWDGRKETLTACAEQAVEIEEAHNLEAFRTYYKIMEQALIEWSKDIALRSAKDANRSNQIIMVHEQCYHQLSIKDKLIDLALKLDARTIPAE